MKALVVFIGLMLGNFLAQWLKADPQYIDAIERSYFQGWALFIYWVFEKYYRDAK